LMAVGWDEMACLQLDSKTLIIVLLDFVSILLYESATVTSVYALPWCPKCHLFLSKISMLHQVAIQLPHFQFSPIPYFKSKLHQVTMQLPHFQFSLIPYFSVNFQDWQMQFHCQIWNFNKFYIYEVVKMVSFEMAVLELDSN
jgi:hypothetical protein